MYKVVVLLSVVSVAVGTPVAGVVPLTYSGVYGPAVSSQYSSSVVHGPYASVYTAPAVYPATYAALAQPPHAPALVLDAVQGVPLDTPEVVAARAAHYQAKALAIHHLKKRSVVAPFAYSSLVTPYSAPVVSAYSTSVVSPYAAAYSPLVSAYSAPVVASPLSYHGVVPKALSVHPW